MSPHPSSSLNIRFPHRPLFALLVFACLPFCCGTQAPANSEPLVPQSTPPNPTAESLLSPPSDPENPNSPSWRRPPAHCLWEITFHFGSEASEQPSRHRQTDAPRKVTLVQHGRESVAKLETQSDKHFEFWNLHNAEIDEVQGQLRLRAARHSQDARTPSRPSEPHTAAATEPAVWQEDWLSLKSFQWVLPEFLRGVLTVGSERLHIFVNAPTALSRWTSATIPAERGPLAGLPLVEGLDAAAIHQDSLLPAMLQRGAEVRTYKFTPLAIQRLEIPAHISVFLENLRARKSFKPRPMP